MLDDTLDEEAETDRRLTKIATGGLFSSGVNQDARDNSVDESGAAFVFAR